MTRNQQSGEGWLMLGRIVVYIRTLRLARSNGPVDLLSRATVFHYILL
jgi:hypothetical protein